MFSERGFSLLEVLIATTIVAVALSALAQLFMLSMNANRNAKATTMATVLAAQKMEQLRSLTWSLDARGTPLTDPYLASLPSGSLRQNAAGFFDLVSSSGESFGEGTTVPAGAMYLRRWSIEPLPADSGNAIVLQVLVTQRFERRMGAGWNARRLPEDSHLITVRTRKGT
jgi:prepilin-type N-terminal cleavage/methylation domain-containing protein